MADCSTPHKFVLCVLVVMWATLLSICIGAQLYIEYLPVPAWYVIFLWMLFAFDTIMTLFLFFNFCSRSSEHENRDDRENYKIKIDGPSISDAETASNQEIQSLIG